MSISYPEQAKQPKVAAKPANFFISYNERDLVAAECFRAWLEQIGHTTFLQHRDSRTATNFLAWMNDGIKCQRLLAVYTADYANSPECMEELWAMRKRDPSGVDGRVVIVKLDATEPPPLLATRVHVNLVGKSGDAVRTEFIRCISALPKSAGGNKRQPTAIEQPPAVPSPSNPASVAIQQHGNNNVAVGGNYAQHFHDHATPYRKARAKPPVDVVTEEQAVRVKSLLDELIELDRQAYGVKLTEAQLRGKWWGALYKHVPATTFKNFTQRKFNKAVKWAQEHKARLLTESRGDQSIEWRNNAYARIKAHMKARRLVKEQYYPELSERVHIKPAFTSLTMLSDDELNRVYGAVARDSRKV